MTLEILPVVAQFATASTAFSELLRVISKKGNDNVTGCHSRGPGPDITVPIHEFNPELFGYLLQQ